MVAAPNAAARRRSPVVLGGALLLAVLGWLVAPSPVVPGPEATGDHRLAEELREAAGPGRYGLSAAVVADGTATFAGIGDDGTGAPVSATTPFEIGSVTKTMTGAVLAALERDGTVRATERVRDVVVDREWGAVGDVTLAELASHRSGLPVQAGGWSNLVHNLGNTLLGTAPRSHTPEQVFDAADAATLGPRGEAVYSNLAYALLGQALAARTGTPYPELVERHVTGPLGMTATTIPPVPPVGSAIGHDEAGRVVAPWISRGDAPAGTGVWSTVADLVRYASALDRPGSPVADAAAARFPSEFGRIGYGWYTVEVEGHTLLWKNGGSGGVSSSVLSEPATGRTAIVLGNSEAGVDRIAAELIGVPSPFDARPDGADAAGWFRDFAPVLIAVAFPLFGGATVLAGARGGWVRPVRPVRRTRALTALGSGSSLLGYAWLTGAVDGTYAPFWMLGCALAGAGWGLVVAGRRSWVRDRGPGARGRRVSAVFSLLVAVALGVAVVMRLLV